VEKQKARAECAGLLVDCLPTVLKWHGFIRAATTAKSTGFAGCGKLNRSGLRNKGTASAGPLKRIE
jgi:hypothetical protein